MNDDLPLGDLYAEREAALLDAKWSITLEKTATPVDASGGSLDQAAAGAKRMPKGGTQEPLAVETPVELQEPVIRRVLDAALKAVSGGLTIDQVEQAIREGTLPDLVSLKTADPIGNVFEAVARKTASDQQLAPELVDKIGGTAGIVAGMMLPGGRKLPKVGAEAARKLAGLSKEAATGTLKGANINLARVNAERSTKGTMAAINALHAEKLEGARKTVTHAQTIAEASGRLPLLTAEEIQVTARRFDRLSEQEVREAATLTGKELDERFRKWADEKDRLIALKPLMSDPELNRAIQLSSLYHDLGVRAAQIRRPAVISLDDALKLDVEKFDFRAVQLAVRDYHNAAATHLDDLVKKTLSGDEAAGNQLWDAFTIAGELSIRDELLGKVAARALESRKILSEAERAAFDPAMLSGLAQTLKGAAEGDAMLLAKRLAALSKTQQQEFARQAAKAVREGKPNLMFEIWMNWGLLSGLITHAANTVGNALVTAWVIPERFFSALASHAEQVVTLGRHPRTVFYGEAAALLFGDLMAQKQAILAVGKALRTGVSGIGPEKVELGAAAAKQMMLQGDNAGGHAMGFWATAWRAPTRLLTAEDAYFKWVNYTGEMWAQGYREAALQGKTGRAFAQELFRVVREKPTLAHERAQEFALVNTMNRELSELGNVGRFGGGILDAIRALPGGRLIAAFKRTPVNVMHYTVERTPILQGFADTLRADLVAGGDRRALAMGKIMGGASLASVVSWYTTAGLITGDGPRDPNVRKALMETGWRPCSLKLGGTYYSLNRIDPVGAMICTVASATELAGNLPEYRVRDVATALALALARNMTSKSYLEGPSNVLDALERPDRDIGKILTSLSRTLVPSVVRGVARVVDPTLRETSALPDEAMREVNEFLNELASVIPGFSDSLPPRRNLFGEPVVLPGAGWAYDMLSPVYASPTKDDPVAQEIARLRVSISPAPRTIYGRRAPRTRLEDPKPDEGIELTPNEYDQYVRLAGNELKVNGQGMKDTLASLIGTDAYTRQSDEMKKILVARVVMAFRDAARAKLLDDNPGLVEAVEDRTRTRADSLSPRGPSGLAPTLGR